MKAAEISLALVFGGVAGFILGALFLPSKQELLVAPTISHRSKFLRAIYLRRNRLLNILVFGIPALVTFFCLVVAPLLFLRVMGRVSPPGPIVAILALPAGGVGGHVVRSRLWRRYISRLTIRSSGSSKLQYAPCRAERNEVH